jgi:hypothetical protein
LRIILGVALINTDFTRIITGGCTSDAALETLGAVAVCLPNAYFERCVVHYVNEVLLLDSVLLSSELELKVFDLLERL